MTKKSIFILLLFCILFSGAGCGNKKEADGADGGGGSVSGESDVIAIDFDEEYFYRKEVLNKVKMNDTLDFTLHENRFFLTGSTAGSYVNEQGFEDWITAVQVFSFSLDGILFDELTFNAPGQSWFPLSAGIDDAGNIWVLYFNFEQTDEAHLVACYDPTGLLLKSIYPDMSGFGHQGGLSLLVGGQAGDGFYIYTNFFEQGYAGCYDREGTLLFGLYGVMELCELPDGRLVARRSLIEESAFFDVGAAGDLGKQYPAGLTEFSFYANGSGIFDVLEVASDGVYGLRLLEGKRMKLIDWMSQRVNFTSQRNRVIMSGDDIYYLGSDGGATTLYRFSRTDEPPETTERKIITLAATSASMNDRYGYAINQFNQTNPDYEIRITRYQYDDEADNKLHALDMDIAMGNIPDAFLFDSFGMAFGQYAAKGLFTDLYEFFDNDPDIGRDDYLGNVLALLETDGKLFTMIDSFSIVTVVGRTADVGTGTGWNWDEFDALMASKPAGTIPVSPPHWAMYGEDFFREIHGFMISEFIDYSAKKCHYDTPAFINLLEAAKKYYPEQTKYTTTQEGFLSGNPLLMMHQLYGFNFHYSTLAEARYFGEEITYIGFPTQDGKCGSVLWPYYEQFAISAQSDVKEGAWQFFKYVLTELQHLGADDSFWDVRMAFPVKISAFQESAENEIAYFEERGGYGYDSQDLSLTVRGVTERDVQKIYDLVDSLSVMVELGSAVYTIVQEEVSAFFSGQKPAEDVAAIIQNRVSLVLKEMD